MTGGSGQALQPLCFPAVPLPGWSPSRNQKLELGNKFSSTGNPADAFHPERFLIQCPQSRQTKSQNRDFPSPVLPQKHTACQGWPSFPSLCSSTSSHCERNTSPSLQHQKHLQDRSWCGYGLDRTQRGCPPSKWDKTSSQKEQRSLPAMKSLGLAPWICPWKLHL